MTKQLCATSRRDARAKTLAGAMLCGSALASAGCWSLVELPAPATPPQEVPGVGANLGPPAPGRQWLVLDTPGDTAHVATVTGTVTGVTSGGHAVTGEGLRDLCVTPCVADLRLGTHTLVFASDTNPGRHDRVDVQLQTEPLVVRHVIEEPAVGPMGARLMVLVGGSLLIAGAVMTPVGAAEKPIEPGGPGALGAQPPKTIEYLGIGMLGVGAATVGLGIVLSYIGRGHHTPGATTQWTIPRSGAATSWALPASGPPALLRF
jgi:hypothetical protein